MIMRSFFHHLKSFAYLPLARYFAFWAGIRLRRWNPTVVTVVGSTGKTTLLHLIEAQLGNQARYSHGANSAFGIPFHILGIERKRFYHWPLLFLLAPLAAYRPVRREEIYVTEADADRPGEGQLLAKLLKPHILVWLSLDEAHGVKYDYLTAHNLSPAQQVRAVKEEMAHEFGFFVAAASQLVILDQDNELIVRQARRAKKLIGWMTNRDFKNTEVAQDRVLFPLLQGTARIPALIPIEAGCAVAAAVKVAEFLGVKPDLDFTAFSLPPGRSSVFRGRHDTTLIDSTYNATIGGMAAMLGLFARYPAKGPKWLVLGDMVEQGKSEAAQHRTLAEYIFPVKPEHIVLVGPRLREHTKPLLETQYTERVVSVATPGEAYAYLEKELRGGETILFKGARYLEGIVEKFLDDPADAARLCRRGPAWNRKRKKWGV